MELAIRASLTGFLYRYERRLRAIISLLVAFAAIWLASASAQTINGPVTILVPYAAGGSADIVARLVGEKLQQRLGQSFVIENRPGGSELTATEALVRSAPDGRTLAILSNAITINETLVPNRRYELAKDLVPIAKVIELPFAILVTPTLPVRTVADLVAYAKANPGKLNYGHLGPGSPHYFTMEWFKRAAGIDILAVPYRGAAPAYAALATGEVQVVASGLGAATPFLQGGQARAIAAMSLKRPASMPDLPTIAEAGYPNFKLVSWMGFFAPSGLPAAEMKLLSEEIMKAIDSADVGDRLAKLGLEVATADNATFAKLIQEDVMNWREVIQASAKN